MPWNQPEPGTILQCQDRSDPSYLGNLFIPFIMSRLILVLLIGTLALLRVDALHAQTDLARIGWDPLPDSLFQAWGLNADQVRRLRVIEEDHDAERAQLMSQGSLDEATREQRLRQLATERRREIRAVLQVKQFEDWERRSGRAAAPRK
jgi:hypothetical protein